MHANAWSPVCSMGKPPAMMPGMYPNMGYGHQSHGHGHGHHNHHQGHTKGYQGGGKQVQLVGGWLKGPDGGSVLVPDEIKVKDPAVRGSVLYDVPKSRIEVTYGLWEYLDGQAKGGVHRAQCHRATLCKLYLESRCGQGTKCKSFHIDPFFVQQMRAENNVEFDESFLTEVPIEYFDGTIAAVRYKAIGRTKGLDAYKAALPSLKVTPPAKLCYSYCTHMMCEKDRACELIHVKPMDLKESIRRTPCCYTHGDLTVTSLGLPVDEIFEVAKPGCGVWSLPLYSVAMTAGGVKRLRGVLSTADIGSMHVKSRCKFGRGCDRVHVCRGWAVNSGLAAVLATRVPQGGVMPASPGSCKGTPASTYLSTPQATSLSPGTLSIKSLHPPSPSAYSLLSSDADNHHDPPLTNTSFSSSSRRLSAFPAMDADGSQSDSDNALPELDEGMFLQLLDE